MEKEKTTAKIICDSVSPDGVRLTTFVVTFHRFILAELNTHRAFSRNSASSRAIPIKKMLERANTPAMPIQFGSNQPGMQAGTELDPDRASTCKALWKAAAFDAIHTVSRLDDIGLHKQVTNRLLEPFLWHTAIITATDLGNFFNQRCHPDAQPEMKALADAIQVEYYSKQPSPVGYDQWHLPFIQPEEWVDLPLSTLQVLSVARCARVSYLNHDGQYSLESDFKVFDKLTRGMHPSPFEHVATPCTHADAIRHTTFKLRASFNEEMNGLDVTCKLTGNFTGWHQFRKGMVNENRVHFTPNIEMVGDQNA
jgi:hypothetical protein